MTNLGHPRSNLDPLGDAVPCSEIRGGAGHVGIELPRLSLHRRKRLGAGPSSRRVGENLQCKAPQ